MKRSLLILFCVLGIVVPCKGQNMQASATSPTDRVYKMANGTLIISGEISDQEKTPDGKLAQLMEGIPGSSGNDPTLALYNPYSGELEWSLRLDLFLPTDMQVTSDSNGRYFIWVSTLYGELLKVDSAGQVVESFQLDEIGGNLTGKSNGAGYTYQIMKMAWNLAAANTLYLCVRYFDPTQEGYGIMLVALNIASNAIIQQHVPFVIDGSGFAFQSNQYEIRDFIIGPQGILALLLYDAISHQMTHLLFNTALEFTGGYASPFFWFDFNRILLVNNHLLLAGTENYLLTGGALLGVINPASPGILQAYVFTPFGGLGSNYYWNFRNMIINCPGGASKSKPACPVTIIGDENNYIGVLESFDPFLVEIPDFTNITSADRKIIRLDTSRGNQLSILNGGTVAVAGYTGHHNINKAPWMSLSSPSESTTTCHTSENIEVQNFNYTLSPVSVLTQVGVPLNKKSWSLSTYIDSLLFEESCWRNCNLTADMLLDDTTCIGEPVEFISISSGSPGPAYYAWRFSDGTVIQGTNKDYFTRKFSTPGTYTVTLIVSDDFACVDSVTDTFVICPPPIAAIFSGDPVICLGAGETDVINFQDVSTTACGTIVSRIWKEKGKIVSYDSTYSGVYRAGDTVNVTLIVINSYDCMDSATVYWEYHLKPGIDSVSVDTEFIQCDTVVATFTPYVTPGSAPIVDYKWTFEKDLGNGQKEKKSGNDLLFILPETSSGNWSYTLVVIDANGCSDTFDDFIILKSHKGPTAVFNSNAPVCFNAPFTNIQFQDLSVPGDAPIVLWQWDFGDATPISNLQNPAHAYANPGNFNVTLTVTDANGCTNSIKKVIQIYTPPIANFQAPSIACLGAPITLLDKSIPGDAPINSWVWVSKGLASFQQNPVHTFNALGTFAITLTVTDTNGCTDNISKDIMVSTVIAHINGPSEACTGEALQFSANAEPVTSNFDWSWDFGDGGSSTDQNPVHSFQKHGTYNVSVIARDLVSGCSDQATMDVNIYTTPNAFYAEDSFCINADSVLFSDSSQAGSDNPINSWAWFFADTILYGPKVYYHPIDTLEEQLVTLKVNTVHQCSDSYDDSVYFFLDTLLNPGFKVTYNGHMVTVTDTTKNSIRNDWDFGDGTTLADTSGPVTHIYANGGKKYLITMTAYSRCDVDTVQQWTELIATGIEPQAAAFDFQILPNPNNGIFSLVAGKGYSHYVWIEITDLSGRPVWENEWNPVESGYKIPVDLRQSAKGLYVVNIHTKEGNITRVLAYQ